jgi:hypothetical protein
MSDRLRRNQSDIKHLQRMNCQARRSFLKHCNPEFIDCICEGTKNLLHGNVPVSATQFKKLKPYKKLLRQLSNNKLANNQRRQLLVKQKGGFIGTLLGPLATVATMLVDRFANRN